MSVDHLYFEWWVEDGAPWVRHECVDGLDEWRVPNTRWSVTSDGPRPSFDCEKCGRHTILTASDHVDRVAVPLGDRTKAASPHTGQEPDANDRSGEAQ